MAEPAPAATLTDCLARAAELTRSHETKTVAGLRILDRREKARWASWHEVLEGARWVGARLSATGVAAGDRVGLVYPTCFEFFHAFFGVLLAGAIPVPLYPPVRLGRLEEYHERSARLLDAVEACLVLADSGVRRLLGETVSRTRLPRGCRVLAELDEPGTDPVGPPAKGSPTDLALIQFSSGTTVEPKPVALSHRAILHQVRSLNGFWPDTPELRHSGVSWLPLYHDMGLIGSVFAALERPAPLTLLGPEAFVARPALWLRALSRYRATVSPAPNFAYALCVAKVRDDELKGVDLSSWRVALNGSETVAPAVVDAFRRRFAAWGLRPEAMTPVYGLSEAALAVTFNDPRKPCRVFSFDPDLLARGEAREVSRGLDLVSVGRPVPGFEIRLRGKNGEEVRPGTVGRIWVRGPSLMEGYFRRPQATRRALRDGWLDTGDLGFLHRGELIVAGRAKDLVIIRGRNYAPEAIEEAVDGVEGARRGCAVAVGWMPRGKTGEELLFFVERGRRGPRRPDEDLVRDCRKRILARVGITPSRVVVLAPGTLPRTSSGKLRRQETLRRFVAGTLDAPQGSGLLRMAAALARSRRAFRRFRRRGLEVPS